MVMMMMTAAASVGKKYYIQKRAAGQESKECVHALFLPCHAMPGGGWVNGAGAGAAVHRLGSLHVNMHTRSPSYSGTEQQLSMGEGASGGEFGMVGMHADVHVCMSGWSNG